MKEASAYEQQIQINPSLSHPRSTQITKRVKFNKRKSGEMKVAARVLHVYII